MQNKFLLSFILFLSINTYAEQTYTPFIFPESVAEGPDGSIYVSEIGKRDVDKDGKISKIDKDGKISTLAKGLFDPKGIVFFENKLYVTDRDVILEVNLDGSWNVHTGTMAFPKTPVFLNDIDVSKNGDLYVSDTGDFKNGGFIFLIQKSGEVSVMFEGNEAIKAPNGLLPIGDTKLLIADWNGELLEANLKNNKISTISNGFDGGDGLAYKDGIIYVSSWKKGIVYRVENGKVSTFADGFSAAADIALSLDKKKLMIPDMKGGTVTIIKAE